MSFFFHAPIESLSAFDALHSLLLLPISYIFISCLSLARGSVLPRLTPRGRSGSRR